MVEGKYHPGYISTDCYEKSRKAVCLNVWIGYHIYSIGKVLILDSGFCVLQGIIEIKIGVFAKLTYQKGELFPYPGTW